MTHCCRQFWICGQYTELGRPRTPYTAMYNDAVSYGAKIVLIQVLVEHHVQTKRVTLHNFKGAYVAPAIAHFRLAMLHTRYLA